MGRGGHRGGRCTGAQHRLLTEVADLVDAGVLRTTFKDDYGRINAANLERAHALMERGRAVGKVVLSGC